MIPQAPIWWSDHPDTAPAAALQAKNALEALTEMGCKQLLIASKDDYKELSSLHPLAQLELSSCQLTVGTRLAQQAQNTTKAAHAACGKKQAEIWSMALVLQDQLEDQTGSTVIESTAALLATLAVGGFVPTETPIAAMEYLMEWYGDQVVNVIRVLTMLAALHAVAGHHQAAASYSMVARQWCNEIEMPFFDEYTVLDILEDVTKVMSEEYVGYYLKMSPRVSPLLGGRR